MKKSLIILAIAAMFAAACDKYVPVYTNTDDSKNAVLNLKGSISSGVGGLGTSWTEGAQISAFVGYNVDLHQVNVLFEAGTVEGTTASFTTKIKKVEEQTSYVALYPYAKNNAYDATQDIVSFSLPTMQAYVDGGVAAGVLPMIAKSSSQNLEFKQLCGIFRISLTGDAKVNSIEVEGLRIAGACTANAATGAISMGEEASDKITVTFPESVTLGTAPTVFNVVLPPATYSALYYTVFAEDGSQMSAYDEDVTIAAGAAVNASATAYVPDGTGGDDINPDLGANGPANCYLVTAPGDYYFKCMLPDGNGTIATGVKATWVWAISGLWTSQEEASAEKLVKDVAYNSEKGEISFTVPEDYTYGNVLLALLDASNKISYGWHIWLTSKVSTVSVGGVEFMDRNLGAGGVLNVNDTDMKAINNSVGLNYQWGRKDAHPGPYGFISSDETTAFSAGSSMYSVINTGIENVSKWNMGSYTIDDSMSKLLWAGQNPCTLVSSGANANIFPACGLNQWAAEADPCPAGYHVPSRAQLNKLKEDGVERTSVKNADNTLISAAVFNGALVMPICGYRNASKAKAPIDGRYWAQDHESTNQLHGYWYQITAAPAISDQTANEIHSSFVRCVKN